jgi:hypothetical protein
VSDRPGRPSIPENVVGGGLPTLPSHKSDSVAPASDGSDSGDDRGFSATRLRWWDWGLRLLGGAAFVTSILALATRLSLWVPVTLWSMAVLFVWSANIVEQRRGTASGGRPLLTPATERGYLYFDLSTTRPIESVQEGDWIECSRDLSGCLMPAGSSH